MTNLAKRNHQILLNQLTVSNLNQFIATKEKSIKAYQIELNSPNDVDNDYLYMLISECQESVNTINDVINMIPVI